MVCPLAAGHFKPGRLDRSEIHIFIEASIAYFRNGAQLEIED